MTRIWWRLADLISRALVADERDAVLGDLAESSATDAQAFRDVLGLVIRRQAALWKDWRPWLALITVSGPAAIVLSLSSVRLWGSYDLYFWIARNYADIDPAVLQETHLTLAPGILLTLRGSIVMACLAWTTGFVVGALSRRTIWVSGGLFCTLLLYGGVHSVPVPRILLALIFVPALAGMYLGLHPSQRPVMRGLLWAAAIATALVGHQTWLWWPTRSLWQLQILTLVRYWPLLYLATAASWQRWRSSLVKENHL
jgi:hypothetical protein